MILTVDQVVSCGRPCYWKKRKQYRTIAEKMHIVLSKMVLSDIATHMHPARLHLFYNDIIIVIKYLSDTTITDGTSTKITGVH
jgi:hypothetical protein